MLKCQVAASILGDYCKGFVAVMCVMGCCEGVRTSACKEWEGGGGGGVGGSLKQRVGLALHVVRL